MYNQTQNPAALRSQQDLADGLLALMNRYPFHEITVTQICQEALIARKTFYRNFQSKEGILHFLLDQILQELFDQTDLSDMSFEEEMIYCFSFFYKHKKLLATLHANSLLYLFSEKTARYIRETACYDQVTDFVGGLPGTEEYFINFVASSVTATVELWISRSFDLPPKEIARLTFRLLNRLPLVQ